MPSLRQSFDHEHERLYGQCSPSEPVEIVNLRLGAIGRVEKASLPRLPASDGRAPAPRTSRSMLFDEVTGWIDCPVYDRDGLAPGMRLVGPAVIEDRGASIPLLPDHEATVDEWGIIFIDTKATQRKKVSDSDLVKARS